jgi:hypothetical protein
LTDTPGRGRNSGIFDEEKAWVMDAVSRNGLILVMQRMQRAATD